MITINGKTFRNLQEQVYYLSNLIGDATDVVKNVVGTVTSPSALPAYTSVNYGTTYAVGASSPYNYYVSTASGWVNLGTFPKAGPSGTDGKDGNSIFLTSANLTPNTDYIYTRDIYNPSNLAYKAGDLILATNASGAYLYTVSNVRSSDVLDIVYRTTLSGIQGPKGDTGPQGPKGEPGASADVVSIDFPHGQETVGYNATDGITLVGQTRLTDTNGDTNDVATDISLPIFPGTGINIDAKADNTGVVISATGGGDDIPGYVVSEAKSTIAKAMSHNITGKSIRFIAVSDAHNDSNNKATPSDLGPQIQESNKHCGQAIDYIANHIGIDFVAFLGDATWAGTQAATYTQSELNNDIMQTNEYLADGFKGLPQVRCVGNHDQYLTTDGTRLWNKGAYQLYGRYCSGIKNNPGGYGYFDLDNEQVRVIYINTSDAPSSTNAGTLAAMTDEQTNWLAETLLSTGDKTGWKILLLTHVPFDLISSNDVLTAYANGSTYNTYNFADHNNAPILAQVNGHLHCYSYGYVNQAKVRRFTIPNSCYGDNNHYMGRPGYENLADTTTYPKTPDSGKDTAFSLITIDLGNNTCYVDNYGAGIDREFSCDYNVPPPPATNQIPISTDTDGSIYCGSGYCVDTRLPTNGIPTAAAGYLTTGFMPFTVGKTIYVNKFCLSLSEQSNCKVAFYSADHTIIAATSAFGLINHYGYTVGQPLTWVVPSTVFDTGSGTNKDISTAAYIRLSIGGYNDTADSIVCNIT